MNSKPETKPDIADIMVRTLASWVDDGMLVHVGTSTFTGLVASILAKATHAPNCTLVALSTSGFMSDPFVISLSLAEGTAMSVTPTVRVTDIYNHVEQNEACEFEPLIPVQIDMYGNVNLSMIGSDYARPKVRLPGPAGLDILAVMMRGKLRYYTTNHTRRVFVPKVDFITGAGYLDGPGARERAGIRGDGGPGSIVSNLGVFEWDPVTCRMRAVSLHPGVTAEQVADNTGFEVLGLSDDLPRTAVPSADELALMRRIDPFDVRRLEFLSGPERRKVLVDVLAAEERLALGRPDRAYKAMAFR